MYCPKCGTNNPEGAAFCASCGTPVSVPNQSSTQQNDVQQNAYSRETASGIGVNPAAAYAQPADDNRFEGSSDPYIAAFSDTEVKKKPKLEKKTIIIIASAAAAVIIALILILTLSGGGGGASSVEEFADKYANAYYQKDIEGMLEIIPGNISFSDIIDILSAEEQPSEEVLAEAFKMYGTRDIKEIYKQRFDELQKTCLENLTSEYGGDYRITAVVTGQKVLSGDESYDVIHEYNDDLQEGIENMIEEDMFSQADLLKKMIIDFNEVEGVFEIELKINISGAKGSNVRSESVTVVNINGSYYLLDS